VTAVEIVLVAVIVAGGSMIQTAIGFAFGMFSIPLLLLVGLEPFEAIALVASCVVIQSGSCLRGAWREVDWPTAWLMVGLIVLMQPLGVAALGMLHEGASPAVVRQVFGGIIAGAVVVQWWFSPAHRARVGMGWTVAAGVVSGFMSGLSGMGGPPIVLWVMAHDWTSLRSRATFWAIFTLTTPANIVYQTLRFGEAAMWAAALGLAMLPVLLVGTVPGHAIGVRLPKVMLRRVALGLLLVLAGYMVAAPLVGG